MEIAEKNVLEIAENTVRSEKNVLEIAENDKENKKSELEVSGCFSFSGRQSVLMLPKKSNQFLCFSGRQSVVDRLMLPKKKKSSAITGSYKDHRTMEQVPSPQVSKKPMEHVGRRFGRRRWRKKLGRADQL